MSFSLVLLLVSKVGISYGVGTADITAMIITPFQMLNAEHLPVWFSKRKTILLQRIYRKLSSLAVGSAW